MRSYQLNFFIHPNDLMEIEKILLKNNALFVAQPIFDLDNYFTETIQYSFDDKQFNKIFLIAKEFCKNIHIKKVEGRDYYLIDDLQSEVIEFSRGGFLSDENKLDRARFYYNYSYFIDNNLREKSPEFKKWADKLFKEMKRGLLLKDKLTSISYFTDNVKKWMEENNGIVHKSGLYITF